MSCNFHVGQKVVCVKDIAELNTPEAMQLFLSRGGKVAEVNSVYTIRGIWIEPHMSDSIGVFLEEIVNPPMLTAFGAFEFPMEAVCFRPVVERKTDISIFKAMLNPSKQKVQA